MMQAGVSSLVHMVLEKVITVQTVAEGICCAAGSAAFLLTSLGPVCQSVHGLAVIALACTTLMCLCKTVAYYLSDFGISLLRRQVGGHPDCQRVFHTLVVSNRYIIYFKPFTGPLCSLWDRNCSPV